MDKMMNEAFNEANLGLLNHDGGPFGAIIVKDNKIISSAHNTVLKDNDPTAHAEVNAIRKASSFLNNYDLSGCTLYTTAEPCPMCMAAIIWANIKNVYYGCDRLDTERIGFRDQKIYDYFERKNNLDMNVKQLNREECLELFKKYHHKIY